MSKIIRFEKKKLVRVGNSYAIMIPKALVENTYLIPADKELDFEISILSPIEAFYEALPLKRYLIEGFSGNAL